MRVFAHIFVAVALLTPPSRFADPQAWLIGDERAALLAARPGLALPPAWQRFVPFAGLAAWLATRPRADAQQE